MPSLYVIAGPEGAGKTTFIKRFAPRELALLDFLNVDEIEIFDHTKFDKIRGEFSLIV